MATTLDIRDKLDLEPNTVGDTDAEHVMCSIAISLKRLADVADATAMGLWNYDPSRTPTGASKAEQVAA